MVLSHTLKNTGERTIETVVYDHNFFVMDKEPVGRGFVVKLPFAATGQPQGTGDAGKIINNEIAFLKDLAGNEHLQYLSLQGFDSSPKSYDISVENHRTGAAVRITSDQPLSKLAFWSAHATICPEPYITIKVEPGKAFSWKIFYHFYTCDKSN